MQKIFKEKEQVNKKQQEFPEAELIRCSITVRKMDLPQSITMTKRSLLRWFCLSVGIISEKESRRTAIEIIDSLFYFLFNKKINPSAEQIKKHLEEKKGIKTSERLVRYHLDKLTEIKILEKRGRGYAINAAPQGERDDFVAAFEYHLKNEFEQSLKQILFALEKLIEKYKES
ncbi:MAG: winged-helix domain-containing protein [Candidatus Diapherotrites archaeon]